MRIALLVPTMETGGVERVFVNLASGLRECGAQVDLVVGRAGGPMTRFVPRDVQVFDLESDRMLKSVPRLAKYLRTRKPEALIAGMTQSSAAAVLARALIRGKTKIVATEHNMMSWSVANHSQLKYRLMPRWGRLAFQSADHVVAVSAGLVDDLSAQTGISPDRFRVIYNPVISDALYAAAAEPLEHPWFQSGQPPVILAVGRLDRQKDFPMLIRAFRYIRDRRPARLVILGEGSDRSRIENVVHELRLNEDVALPGSEPNPYRFMKRAAAFALSSESEGFGVVLVEALALGLPVVSTNCTSGPAEILCDGEYGALVPTGDHEAMARALLRTLEGPARLDNSQHVQRFTISDIASQYISLISS
jgi:glycosyltransferase involved in cell wall biosynthesis